MVKSPAGSMKMYSHILRKNFARPGQGKPTIEPEMNGDKRQSGLINAKKPLLKGTNAQKSLFISVYPW